MGYQFRNPLNGASYKRAPCQCPAYPFPHRVGGGACNADYPVTGYDDEQCTACGYSPVTVKDGNLGLMAYAVCPACGEES